MPKYNETQLSYCSNCGHLADECTCNNEEELMYYDIEEDFVD